MAQHHSTQSMVKRLEGLLGTKDLTEWQQKFVWSCVRAIADRRVLTEEQIEVVTKIHDRHFA